MQEKLKNCPFCNGTATLHSTDMCETIYAVCMNCGCRTIDYKHAQEAIEKWNRRANAENYECEAK